MNKKKENQLALISEDDLQAIIRPEENLEKWSNFLFPHPKTKGLTEIRGKEWEVTLKNGQIGIASIRVEPSISHQCYTCRTYDVYLALVNIWEREGRPIEPFTTSMAAICKELNMPSNGRNIKTIEEELHKLLRNNISWTLSYKIDKDMHTVKNQQILDTFDYSSMSERFDPSNKFEKSCVIRFHNKILNNLLNNKTIPVNFAARKTITSPIAKVQYNTVDTILCSTNRQYSRTAINLVEDLYLTKDRYKYISQRKTLVETLKKNLHGKTLSNMNKLHVDIELTADKSDWKCIFRSVSTEKKLSSDKKPKRKLKIVNTDPDIINGIIYNIEQLVGSSEENKKLYKLYAVHYSENCINRALSEFKERMHTPGTQSKGAMFSSILHRIIHELKYEWIKDCGEDCKYRTPTLF